MTKLRDLSTFRSVAVVTLSFAKSWVTFSRFLDGGPLTEAVLYFIHIGIGKAVAAGTYMRGITLCRACGSCYGYSIIVTVCRNFRIG